jgi:hypothetical protein
MPDDPADGATDGDPSDQDASRELPSDVADRAERLTRLARGAVDGDEAAAYRRERDDLLGEYGFTARIREEDAGDDAVLVCYPAEWVEDGVVQIDRIEDVDRGVERPLEGPGDGDWDAVAAENEAVVEAVAAAYDDPHAATARSLADFANNHYAKPIDDLSGEELAEFEEEYFPRNAWPTDEQLEALDDTIEIVREETEAAPGDPP